jgi:hypothetical protein
MSKTLDVFSALYTDTHIEIQSVTLTGLFTYHTVSSEFGKHIKFEVLKVMEDWIVILWSATPA